MASTSSRSVPVAPIAYDTIVIGAGVSGLACASKILQNISKKEKHYRLLVLEARNRIGGRVNSVHVNGCRLDTGANWIHGVGTGDRPNPLMGILPEKRVRELSGSVAFRPPPPAVSEETREGGDGGWEVVQGIHQSGTSDGSGRKDLVLPPQIGGTLMGRMWMMFEALHEAAHATPADEAKRTTMLQAIAKSDVFQEAFKDLPAEYHGVMRAMPQFIEVMEAAPLAAQSAEGKKDAAGMGLLEFAINDFSGEQVFVQDGYTAVVEELAKDLLDAGSILLNMEVLEVNWEKDPISIKVKDGRVFEAQNVVCSLPLGVLKAKEESIFRPSLPKAKKTAISNLGFGTLDKIFMVYDHAWWTEEPFASIIKKGLVSESGSDDGTEPDMMMGFSHSLPGLAIYPDGQSESSVRTLSLANLHSLTGFPVLSCFVSCANAQQVEALPESHSRNMLHNNLTSWFGREVPAAKAVHVTRWASDEYSRGSYSHMIAGLSETGDREDFKNAIGVGEGGRLAFAGEHTSRNHFATVHGALISGWREADAIVENW